jgi:zinc metalloprotease ZmpA
MRRRVGAAVAAVLTAALMATVQQASAATPTPPASPQAQATIEARALSAVAAHTSAVHGGAGQAFTAVDARADHNGATHTRMARTYQNLPVLGGDFIVNQDAKGNWVGVDQTLRQAPSVTTTPKVSAATAAKVAAQATNGTAHGTAKLVVEARKGAPKLAWQVETTGKQADGTPSRESVTVDASSGKVVIAVQQIWTLLAPRNARSVQHGKAAAQGKTAPQGRTAAQGRTVPDSRNKVGPNVAGDGQSLYSGTVPLETTQSGNGFQLADTSRGNTYTTNLNGGTGSDGAPMTDDDNHWGDGTNNDPASAAVDAQYGTGKTWDYYKNVHGRTGIGNDGVGSHNNVHYSSAYDNAFWDDTCFCMTYGDGDGSVFNPLVSLDVTGHEMSHGVTSRTAGLIYAGESGGLNEATSDIFGTSVEFYADNPNDVGDYLIGEEVSAQGGALRYMDQPSKDGSSLDCWTSGAGGVDVHFSSGIANHFFYLLSEGSGAKNINGVSYNSPTCDGSTVTGIGRADAEKIWYQALTAHFTSGTQYSDARAESLEAAADLFGSGSSQYNTVAAAWSAVNVS